MKKNKNVYANLKCLRYEDNFLLASFSRRQVPVKFDADEILSKEHPEGYSDIERDELVLIASYLFCAPAWDKKAIKWEYFINVYPHIKDLVPDYLYYLSMLTRHDVIFSSEEWHFDGYPKIGFAFTEEYETPGFKVEHLRDTATIDLVMREGFKRLNGINVYPQLSSFFFSGYLGVDLEAYQDFLVNDWEPKANEFSPVIRGANLHLVELNAKLTKVFDLYALRYLFSSDPSSGLISTSLTELPKDARQFVSYGGGLLSEVSVKELPLLLFTAFLDADSWGMDEEFFIYLQAMCNRKSKGKIQPKPGLPLISGMHKKLSFNEYRLMYSHSIVSAKTANYKRLKEGAVGSLELNGKGKLLRLLYETPLTPSMARMILKLFNKSGDTTESIEVTRFLDHASRGDMYDMLADVTTMITGNPLQNEEGLEDSLGFVIFGMGYKTPQQLALADTFKERFPVISQFIKLINKLTIGNLVGFLEVIDSKFIVDVVCKRINTKRSSIPISPLHYGVVTTDGNVTFVEQVIREEVQKLIGLPCVVKVIPWRPEDSTNSSSAMAA